MKTIFVATPTDAAFDAVVAMVEKAGFRYIHAKNGGVASLGNYWSGLLLRDDKTYGMALRSTVYQAIDSIAELLEFLMQPPPPPQLTLASLPVELYDDGTVAWNSMISRASIADMRAIVAEADRRGIK